MHFEFSEDQRMLQQAVRDFLAGECPPAALRALWSSESGRSPTLWRQLAEVGLVGALVPEAHGGMGLDERDFVLLAEEVGRAGVAEPVIGTAAVAAPLLRELGDDGPGARWLGPLARGEAVVAVLPPQCPFASDAGVAELLLLAAGDAVHALPADRVKLELQPADDPAERLYRARWTPTPDTRLAEGATGAALWAAAFDRGALAAAAQLVGVADRLIGMAVDYASQRKQFGVPIGSFQAVKHALADVKVKLEYARPLVYRAADSVARALPARAVHVSMAKLAAGEAAQRASRVALQVHGAIGYTWEQDLHLWMRRAWSLDAAWGLPRLHRRRMADFALAEDAPLGAGHTFP